MDNKYRTIPAGVSVALLLSVPAANIAFTVPSTGIGQAAYAWPASLSEGAVTVATPWIKAMPAVMGYMTEEAETGLNAVTRSGSGSVMRFGSISLAALLVGVAFGVASFFGVGGSGTGLAMSFLLVVAGLAATRASMIAQSER